MTSRASCIRSRACDVERRRRPRRGRPPRRRAIGQVGPGEDDRDRPPNGPGRSAGPPGQSPPEDSRLCSAAPTQTPSRGPRARLHRQDRHPVPEQPVRRRRLRRRDARDGDRIGDDPAALGADPAVRRLPGVGPEPDRAADRPALELLDRGHRGDHREHARLAHRLRHRRVRRPAVPRALRQVPAHPPARDRAGRLVLRAARRRDRVHRPAAADRPDVHQLPGRRRPDADLDRSSSSRPPARSSGRACWSTRARSSARTGRTSGTRSSRSTWPSRSSSCWRSCCSSGGGSGCPAGRAAAARMPRRPPRPPRPTA